MVSFPLPSIQSRNILLTTSAASGSMIHFFLFSGFFTYPWFMKGLGSASTIYPIFDDNNPYFVESLIAMLEDEKFIDSISEEQLRMFKNYASIAPSWRKKESIACDLYFPILLALSKAGAI